jgi:hypothetical protein
VISVRSIALAQVEKARTATFLRSIARSLALVTLVLAACGARPCPPPAPCPPPPMQGQTMLVHDDSSAAPAVFAIDLAIAGDAATQGRVILRIVSRGKAPVTIAVPDHPAQVEWFDPEMKTLRAPTPYVAWSAWRIDNAGLALDSRTSTAQRASRYVTLRADEPHEVAVDIGAALDGLRGPGTFARGWCTRAWLIGGTHPLPSNILCWPRG